MLEVLTCFDIILIDMIRYLFIFFFHLNLFSIVPSVEGDGDVLPDSGSRKECYSEGVILQAAMRITTIFYISITGQQDNPR